MDKPPFETEVAIELQRLRAEVAALSAVIRPIIIAFIAGSAPMREEYEGLLGTAKAAGNTLPEGKTAHETELRIMLAALERILGEISAELDRPLLPRAVLGTV